MVRHISLNIHQLEFVRSVAFVNRARKAVAQISHVRIIISGPTEMNVSAEMEDV